jgi:hypothetical protein
MTTTKIEERYPTNATAFSFVGATKRLLRWTYAWRSAPVGLGWLGIVPVLLIAWTLCTVWFVMMILSLPIAVPWRIVRRNQRAAKRLNQQQLAALHDLKTN